MSFLKGINNSKKGDLPKLVRDKIPKIIRSSGNDYIATVEKDPTILTGWLAKKISEELDEYRAAPDDKKLEEAADMFAVCQALWGLSGLCIEDIMIKAAEKAKTRGEFNDGIILWDIITK